MTNAAASIKLTHNTQLTISCAASRKGAWHTENCTLSEFYQRLHDLCVSNVDQAHTHAAFLQLPARVQGELKDCGAYVGGVVDGPRRLKRAITSRCLIALDFDDMDGPGALEQMRDQLAALGVSWCLHGTRKHTPDKPRVRVVIPLSHAVSPSEYEQLSKHVAGQLQLAADPSTYEPERQMYWPSRCCDVPVLFEYADAPLLDADQMLSQLAAAHADAERPSVEEEQIATAQSQPTAADYNPPRGIRDPRTVRGFVGRFCRSFDIHQAISTYLEGVYEPTDNPDRYKYIPADSEAGLVVLDGGLYACSHHSTDPAAAARCCNAFDLVRIHCCGAQASVAEAKKWLLSDERLRRAEAARIRIETSQPKSPALPSSLEGGTDAHRCKDGCLRRQAQPEETVLRNFLVHIKKDGTVLVDRGIANHLLVLEHDSRLAGKIKISELTGQLVCRDLPWPGEKRAMCDRNGWRSFTDSDDAALCAFIDIHYDHLFVRQSLDIALQNLPRYSPLTEYLESCGTWDGTERIDTLLHKICGAEDSEFNRVATRLWLAAAVAKAYKPDCAEFQHILVLMGGEGVSKTRFFEKLSQGWLHRPFLSARDGGKAAKEAAQGAWVLLFDELGVLDGEKYELLKTFITAKTDDYRPVWGRWHGLYCRGCVLGATTNHTKFIADQDGARRFLPVLCGVTAPQLRPDDIDWSQIWAEAVHIYQTEYANTLELMLPEQIWEAHAAKRYDAQETSELATLCLTAADELLPEDWPSYTLDERRLFWHEKLGVDLDYRLHRDRAAGTITLPPSAHNCTHMRTRVCARELWGEVCGGNQSSAVSRKKEAEIQRALDNSPHWRRLHGKQRIAGYIKFSSCAYERKTEIPYSAGPGPVLAPQSQQAPAAPQSQRTYLHLELRKYPRINEARHDPGPDFYEVRYSISNSDNKKGCAMTFMLPHEAVPERVKALLTDPEVMKIGSSAVRTLLASVLNTELHAEHWQMPDISSSGMSDSIVQDKEY